MKNSENFKIPEFITLAELGPKLKVRVRRSTRVKRCIIRIEPLQTPELVLPDNNLEGGYRFLLDKEAWVRNQLLNNLGKIALVNNNQLPIWGKAHALQYIEASRGKVKIHEGRLQVYAPYIKSQDTLMEFLMETLSEKIQFFAGLISKKYNLTFTKIRFTNNKSNWGSCNSKGVLSFNRSLIFAPEEVVHYVVVHEMCHLIEMNHNSRFWLLVKQICPNYKFHAAWLKENSSLLHLYLLSLLR